MPKYRQDSDHKYGNNTIIFDAARDGDSELLEFLLMTKRFDVNAKDPYGRTVLGSAAREERCIGLLLATERINVNCQDSLGQTAIFMPAIGGRLQVVQLLLATAGFLPDLKDNSGRTALSYAAGTWKEQAETVEALLHSERVDSDARDQDGRTPFSYASERGHGRVMQLLVDTGKVSVDSRDSRGLTCLKWYRRGCLDRNDETLPYTDLFQVAN
ncbi:putative NACHT domain-containing protein [Seiridium cardinale]|uniref:NACHT domain-containing protein n=1 Tax=Seiridium cardinale TaxID=138064 RepID=A0ABR2X8F0_9PEZI